MTGMRSSSPGRDAVSVSVSGICVRNGASATPAASIPAYTSGSRSMSSWRHRAMIRCGCTICGAEGRNATAAADSTSAAGSSRSRSSTTTSWPARASSGAANSPAALPPAMAILNAPSVLRPFRPRLSPAGWETAVDRTGVLAWRSGLSLAQGEVDLRPAATVSVSARREVRGVVMTKPFRGVINVDGTQSVPDWEPYTQPIAPEGTPSVLYIVLDDVGYSAMGPYGGLIETPNIDRIAQRGLTYTNFHHGAVLADAIVPDDRPEPHHERDGHDHRGGIRVPELERAHTVRVR